MSTVYAHDIHSPIEKITNQVRIVSSLTRHGNHNAHVAVGRCLTERFDRVFLEQGRARIEFGESLLYCASVPLFARNSVKQGQQRVEGG